MKGAFSALLFGAALFACSGGALAQEQQAATTQNPFGGTDQPAPAATKKARVAAPVALKAGQFEKEADAKASCPSDTVVWANLNTKVYHHAGAATYGKTKHGAYMCEKDTAAAGLRAAKREKRK